VEQANGKALNISEGPRRAGDPPTLVAEATRIREVLGWEPRHDDLDFIVSTALAWERRLQQHPAT
jgi:UDP-glucose 4-epimerase